ncbi:MAG: hypothetical protein HKP40_03400 [Litoreibacter sp.]|nr:hypothetical protein [Boseongicola sp.]NNK77737.1 hypothetical protein [Litoreibacter sp.]
MPPSNTDHGEFIKANFRSIWPVHLAGFTRLLVQLRKRFDGDLDLALVLAVIGDRTHPEFWTLELAELSQMTTGEDPDGKQLPINIQSVAAFSGIPRETVRRKVKILQEKGWVTRKVDGRLAVKRDAALDLADTTGDTVAYLASLLMAFEAAQAIGAGKRQG